MLKITTKNFIEELDWSKFVSETYDRHYNFQQQEGCRGRGVFELTVPGEEDDYSVEVIPEVVNGPIMGVSFKAWLARDPEQALSVVDGCTPFFNLRLWWYRNFYPDVSMVANDLHAKGLLPAGEYVINIDW